MPVADILYLNNDGRTTRINETRPVAVTPVHGGPGSGDWELHAVRDATLNSNDKIITVDANWEWQILSIYIEYTSDANAGNRQLQVDFVDSGGILCGQQRPNVLQAQNLTYHYWLGPSLANQAAPYDTDHIQTPLPPTLFLDSNQWIRVYDNNNISALDDFILTVNVARRRVWA